MREIKFRQPLFDKEGKFTKFHYWGLLGKGVFIGLVGDSAHWDKSEEYIGRKDVDGKEIYEGDIVEAWGHQYIISWDVAGAWIFGSKESSSGYVYEQDSKEMKVISHLSEHPELWWTKK